MGTLRRKEIIMVVIVVVVIIIIIVLIIINTATTISVHACDIGWGHACHGMPVEVREQLCGVSSLCLPLYGFWDLNLGFQA